MKYFAIHKAIWAILVIAFTLFQLVIMLFIALLYVIWNFKVPRNWWTELNSSTERQNTWDGTAYSDKNIFETIKRRYKIFF